MRRRIFGIETEYGAAIQAPHGAFTESVTSYTILDLFLKSRYDTGPLHDFFFIQDCFPSIYYSVGPESLPSGYWVGSNGARLYFELQYLGHLPEYSTPECTSIKSVILQTHAGDRILETLRKEALEWERGKPLERRYFKDIFFSRANTAFTRIDTEQKYIGSHENYMTEKRFQPPDIGRREDPKYRGFYNMKSFLLPFLISRVVLHGNGGIRYTPGKGWHFVLSQKAFGISHDSSRITTERQRGIITIRTKEDCPKEFLRLQPVYADSNMAPLSTFLRMGTTHLVLRVLEEHGPPAPLKFDGLNAQWLWVFASDPTLRALAPTVGGGSFTALETQEIYINLVERYVREFSDEERQILELWKKTVSRLHEDPESMSQELDWAIKQKYLRDKFADFENPRARFADFLYGDISERGIYNQLKKRGKVLPLFKNEEELIAHAMVSPESNTRSCVRAGCIREILKKRPDSWRIAWNEVNAKQHKVIMNDPFMTDTEKVRKLQTHLSASEK